jgi:membrane associated rhomboid family serine protease
LIPLSDNTRSRRFPFITIGLIAANLCVFFGWQVSIGLDESVRLAGFLPRALTQLAPGSVLHLLTAMFMHGGFLHLLGNMWFLWVFGNTVESDTGAVRFLLFYLLTGIIATLAHTLSDPLSRMPLVGASGAISGVLGAYLVKHPGASIRTLIPLWIFSTVIEVPAFVFLLIWVGIQFLSESATRGHHGGGVAYLAHIGGFVAGAALIFFFTNEGKQQSSRSKRRIGS